MINRALTALCILLALSQTSAQASNAADTKADGFKAAPPLNLTVPEALKRFGTSARSALAKEFKDAGTKYPPKKITLIGLKRERLLCLFADDNKQKLIASFPLSTFSGKLGPKLREGDLQIPEGIYKITGFRASFRLSLYVDYPNKFDKQQAFRDHRTKIGGDILIHNGTKSTGCLVLSMDDMAQIFIAAHDVGCHNVTLIIAPCNLTATKPDLDMTKQPKWLASLYKKMGEKMTQFKWQ